MYVSFIKIVSRTQQTKKLCSWTYVLENDQVQQPVKFFISSNVLTYAICKGLQYLIFEWSKLNEHFKEWLPYDSSQGSK